MSLDTCENVDVMSPVCFVSSHTVPPAPLQKNKSQGLKGEREKKCRGERWVKKILFRVIPSCCVFLSSGVLFSCVYPDATATTSRAEINFFFSYSSHTHTQHTHTHTESEEAKKKC
ncbi:hypothetical protein OUZ56_008288 [Daphnia magna]|uniref:Uncharacterized protein n=1 Tax=Daphnia magna TaxID=35525 RepID=A0ABR0ACJ0_9CRUS|nr:hypothetical protein OUZ56_008288 [Daphnia magna]